MLARALPGVVVAVGPRRDVVGRAVEARFGPRVHVLDDGFQHLRLARDLDVVCLDVRDLADRPLPPGRLREGPVGARPGPARPADPPRSGVRDRARALEERLGRERVLRVERRLVGFRDLDGAAAAPPPGPSSSPRSRARSASSGT